MTRPHFNPGKDPVPILQEAEWAPGPVWTSGKSRPQRDSVLDRPARSQSLYRLSYPVYNYRCYKSNYGEWSAARPGRTLPPGKTRYPFYRRLSGPQGRSGRAENLVPTEIRSPDRPARSQSLYRLSYPAHNYRCYKINYAINSHFGRLSNWRPAFHVAGQLPFNFQPFMPSLQHINVW